MTNDLWQRGEFWHVLTHGEICVWTLEELDEALAAGDLDDEALVKPVDAPRWSTLAEMGLGLRRN
jgi:hypothetical protein